MRHSWLILNRCVCLVSKAKTRARICIEIEFSVRVNVGSYAAHRFSLIAHGLNPSWREYDGSITGPSDIDIFVPVQFMSDTVDAVLKLFPEGQVTMKHCPKIYEARHGVKSITVSNCLRHYNVQDQIVQEAIDNLLEKYEVVGTRSYSCVQIVDIDIWGEQQFETASGPHPSFYGAYDILGFRPSVQIVGVTFDDGITPHPKDMPSRILQFDITACEIAMSVLHDGSIKFVCSGATSITACHCHTFYLVSMMHTHCMHPIQAASLNTTQSIAFLD